MSSDKPAATPADQQPSAVCTGPFSSAYDCPVHRPGGAPEPANELTGVIREALAGVAEELRDSEPASSAAKGADEVLWEGRVPIAGEMRYSLVPCHPCDAWFWQTRRADHWELASPMEQRFAVELVMEQLRNERAAHEETKRALETATELAEQYRQRAESLSLSLRMAGKGAP